MLATLPPNGCGKSHALYLRPKHGTIRRQILFMARVLGDSRRMYLVGPFQI